MSKRGFGAHVYPGCRDAAGTRIEEKQMKWIAQKQVPEGCKLEVLRIDGKEYLQIVPCPDLSDVMRVLREIRKILRAGPEEYQNEATQKD